MAGIDLVERKLSESAVRMISWFGIGTGTFFVTYREKSNRPGGSVSCVSYGGVQQSVYRMMYFV